MITLILLALVLTLIQLMTPAFLNSKNLEFLISNREGSVEEAPIRNSPCIFSFSYTLNNA